MTIMRILALCLLLLPALLSAQENKVFYYPKPLARTPYQAPMKPVTRLADLKAKHRGEASWRERVIDDGNSLAFMVQEPAGTKYERRLFPDSPAWWAVIEGRIHFEIEKADGSFETVDASKGSYVFVPERMLHSLEVVGGEPAIRFEVTLAVATPVFEKRPEKPTPGIEYLPVRLSTGPNPLDVPDPAGKPWPVHFNVYELMKQNANRRNWTQEAIRKNRARGNLICGQAGEPAEAGNRGHFHSDFAEFWVVMLGELRWTFEGDEKNAIVARQGDIIYAPPKTFHSPQFWGKEGLNCRLTSSTYPSANHFYDVGR
jgi:mannose-6-phosphate isomerase-like protein (cupin superfamily)